MRTAVDLVDMFGRAWRPVLVWWCALMPTAVIVRFGADGMLSNPGGALAAAVAPGLAALLAIAGITEDRVKLLICALVAWVVGVFLLMAPEVARVLAEGGGFAWLTLETEALVLVTCGFFASGAIARAVYLGDEAFVRPMSAALGDARWMSMSDARQLFPADAGVVIGEAYMPSKERRGTQEFHPQNKRTWGSGGKAQILAYDMSFDSTHMLFFAGSGGYKTTSTVVPTALRYQGSMVVLDPALEIGEMVGPVRRGMKHGTASRTVVMIDPEAPVVVGCDVLELLRESKRQDLDVGTYANMLLTEKPKATSGSDAFFEGNTYGLMSGLLMYVLHGRSADYDPACTGVATLRQLRVLTALPEASLKKYIGIIYANDGYVSQKGYVADAHARRFIRQTLAPFVSMAQESWTGISAQVGTDTKWLSVERLAATVCGNAFSIKALPKGGTDVFLQFAGDVVKRNPGVVRVLIGAMFQSMMSGPREVGAKPVLFVLDEVDLLGYMSALEEARDRGRKFGISLMLLYQSVGQIEKHFSKESAQAWFDSAAIVSYAAIKSPDTADRVSKMVGELTVEVEGASNSGSWRDGVFLGLASQSRVTRSFSLQKRPLLLPHEVREMRSDEQVVFVRGKPALRCGRAIFFRRPEMLQGLGESRLRAGLPKALASSPPVASPAAAEVADWVDVGQTEVSDEAQLLADKLRKMASGAAVTPAETSMHGSGGLAGDAADSLGTAGKAPKSDRASGPLPTHPDPSSPGGAAPAGTLEASEVTAEQAELIAKLGAAQVAHARSRRAA